MHATANASYTATAPPTATARSPPHTNVTFYLPAYEALLSPPHESLWVP